MERRSGLILSKFTGQLEKLKREEGAHAPTCQQVILGVGNEFALSRGAAIFCVSREEFAA
jgi:hypothetical protein